MSPEVGSRASMSILAIVVLPEPDSPTRPKVEPAATSKLTPPTACKGAGRPNMPLRTWKTLRRSLTLMCGPVPLTILNFSLLARRSGDASILVVVNKTFLRQPARHTTLAFVPFEPVGVPFPALVGRHRAARGIATARWQAAQRGLLPRNSDQLFRIGGQRRHRLEQALCIGVDGL